MRQLLLRDGRTALLALIGAVGILVIVLSVSSGTDDSRSGFPASGVEARPLEMLAGPSLGTRSGSASPLPQDSTEEFVDASLGTFTQERTGEEPGSEVIEEGMVLNGQRHGVWRSKFADGTLWIQYQYKHGELDGHVITHGPDGNLQADDQYKEGKLSGMSIGWHSNGRIAYEFHYLDGIREGPWTEWRADGKLKAQGESRRDRFEGRCSWFRENGDLDTKMSGRYENGKRVGDLP